MIKLKYLVILRQKNVSNTEDIEISGTEQTFWMKKGMAAKQGFSVFNGDKADYYTWKEIKGWSTKPLDEIIPGASKNMKTVPFDLYSKKTGKSVTFQKTNTASLSYAKKVVIKTNRILPM